MELVRMHGCCIGGNVVDYNSPVLNRPAIDDVGSKGIATASKGDIVDGLRTVDPVQAETVGGIVVCEA